MRSDDYRRLHGACLMMAQQSKLPDMQARWLSMAQAWLKRASVSNDTCQESTELKKVGAARESFDRPVCNVAASRG